VLRACRKLLRPGGRTAFLTIEVAGGLDKKEHRRAVRIGPRAISSTKEAGELLTSAGFTDVRARDVTEEFERTARAWHDEYARNENALRQVLGAELDDLCKNRSDMIGGLEEGLLKRTLVWGSAPEK
jgi:hypothetical protein